MRPAHTLFLVYIVALVCASWLMMGGHPWLGLLVLFFGMLPSYREK